MLFLFNIPKASVSVSVSVAVLLVLLTLLVVYLLLKFKARIKSNKIQSNCYEDSYRSFLDAIVILNGKEQFVYLNPAAEKMLGCKLRSMMGRSYRDAFDFKSLDSSRSVPAIIGRDAEKVCECVLETVMNQSFSINLQYSPISKYEGDEANLSYLVVLKDITNQRLNESQLSNLKRYDGLTEMLKPKPFEAEVKYLIDNSHKYNSQHVLAYFSIDQLQKLNDSIGYAGADSLIKVLGGVINKYVKKKVDIVGRIGGGEFAVVFLHHNLSSAIRTIEAILKAVESCNFTSLGQQYPTTMSAGFVIVDERTTSSARAITEAGVACKLVRKHGGNHLYAYKSENSEIKKLEGNLEWIVILKQAMEEDLFQMYAQPIHLLEESEYEKPFHHYELLIRLFKDGKLIPPDEFLSAAEYYSMMPKVDRWVVRNVLGQIAKIPDQMPLPVFAINLSGQSLNDPRFLDYVIKEVKSSGVDPKMLCFEITEQVAVEDVSLVNQFISSLKALGSQFSLDDFGTGVSGFSYLMALDVDYLKIDGSFVKNIDTDEVSRAMVQSISQVGHTMNLKVIAEYVENQKIVDILRGMGVDYGQGYHILKPGPLLDVAGHHMKKK